MKVLLDENLPQKLRLSLTRHEVVTVGYKGWGGLKNGELLRSAEAAGIEVFVTGDKALSYQQNVSQRRVAIVTLSANSWRIIRHNLSRIADAVDQAVPGSSLTIECGVFKRE